MLKIKYYFMYGLMFNSACLFSMKLERGTEHIDVTKFHSDIHADTICNQIDRDILGIRDASCLKKLIGSCVSWYKYQRLTPQQAAAEIKKIESYIPSEANKADVLEKLIKRHWYVYYVMQVLMREKMYALEEVTGSTVDVLYYGVDEDAVEKMIHSKACKTFFDKTIGRELVDMVPLVLADIHCTVLYGKEDVNPLSFAMSFDGAYLRATDHNATPFIWDMKTGERIDCLQTEEQVKWIVRDQYKEHSLLGAYACPYENRCCVTDKFANYYATMPRSFIGTDPDFFPKTVMSDRKAIVLFQRPQEASYICQKAFYNSYIHVAELKSLLNSRLIKNIEDFPKNNLERVINARIDLLESRKDL